MKIDVRRIRREMRVFLRHIRSDRPTLGVAAVLAALVLTILVAFIVASLTQENSAAAAEIAFAFDPTRERSYAEVVGYGITFLATMMFLLAFLENRAPVLLLLSGMTGYIWFDDSFQLHERFGDAVNAAAHLPETSRFDLEGGGEILSWLLMATVFFLVLRWCLRRLRPGDLGLVAVVFAAFSVLVFFAMVVDFVHTKVPPAIEWITGVIEDGGEMLSFVLIATLATGAARKAAAHYEDCRRLDAEGER